MRTHRIRGVPRRRLVVLGANVSGRLMAVFYVALGIAAAFGGAWLIWRTPHCRPLAAHAYYTPLAAAQCERDAPTRAATRAP